LLSIPNISFLILLLAGAAWSIVTKRLQPSAAVLGALFGAILFAAGGWINFLLMTAFFLFGTLATSWRRGRKEALGLGENRRGREAGQVIANSGVAVLLSVLMLLFPRQHSLFQLLIAAVFSSATADTLSSELGSVYGKKFYNILTFKRDKKGLDGVVSLEGSLFGMLGSALIGVLYCAGSGWGLTFIIIVLAGTAGNLSDSILGATLERRGQLSNNAVNFLNTLIAALFCLLF
jgi:uncharacterized protein (TIGR00297 family)